MATIADARNLNNTGLAQIAPRIDKSTYSPASIDYVKHEANNGTHFFHIESLSRALNEYATVLWQTPNTTTLLHLLLVLNCTNLTDFQLLEGVTDAFESPATIHNNRRISANTPEVIFDAVSTVAATGGTLIARAVIGGTSGPAAFRVGGETSNRHEFVLKPNTKYALQQQMLGATGGIINWEFYFYEHADKE